MKCMLLCTKSYTALLADPDAVLSFCKARSRQAGTNRTFLLFFLYGKPRSTDPVGVRQKTNGRRYSTVPRNLVATTHVGLKNHPASHRVAVDDQALERVGDLEISQRLPRLSGLEQPEIRGALPRGVHQRHEAGPGSRCYLEEGLCGLAACCLMFSFLRRTRLERRKREIEGWEL